MTVRSYGSDTDFWYVCTVGGGGGGGIIMFRYSNAQEQRNEVLYEAKYIIPFNTLQLTYTFSIPLIILYILRDFKNAYTKFVDF